MSYSTCAKRMKYYKIESSLTHPSLQYERKANSIKCNELYETSDNVIKRGGLKKNTLGSFF